LNPASIGSLSLPKIDHSLNIRSISPCKKFTNESIIGKQIERFD